MLSVTGAWPWILLVFLGAYHGLNPGMGWLFALSLGLQQRSRAAVLQALAPIALGHALAIWVTLALAGLARAEIPHEILKFVVAGILIGLGLYRMFRYRHPRGAGMRVGFRDLAAWSFLMASVHGAGLMLVPVVLAHPMKRMQHSMDGGYTSGFTGIAVVVVHTLSLVVVAGALAILFYQFYERWGLGLLRHAWFNFDLLWAFALLIAGAGALAL